MAEFLRTEHGWLRAKGSHHAADQQELNLQALGPAHQQGCTSIHDLLLPPERPSPKLQPEPVCSAQCKDLLSFSPTCTQKLDLVWYCALLLCNKCSRKSRGETCITYSFNTPEASAVRVVTVQHHHSQ